VDVAGTGVGVIIVVGGTTNAEDVIAYGVTRTEELSSVGEGLPLVAEAIIAATVLMI